MNILVKFIFERCLVGWRSTVRSLVLMLVAWLGGKGVTISDGLTEQTIATACTILIAAHQLLTRNNPQEKGFKAYIQDYFKKEKE